MYDGTYPAKESNGDLSTFQLRCDRVVPGIHSLVTKVLKELA